MHFAVSRAALAEALQLCGNAVPARSTLPILQNFLLSVRGGRLQITATDLDLGVRVALPVDMRQDGELVVPARNLLEIVRELPDLPLELSERDTHLVLRSESGFHCRLAGLEGSEYPALPDFEAQVMINIPASTLRRLADRTMFAVSTDQTRLSLNGVCWEPGVERLTMASTDGHRLGWATGPCGEASALGSSLIVPPKAIQQILRVVSREEEAIQVHLVEGSARFRAGAVEVFTKLIEGPYPNYHQVIPKTSSRTAQLRREDLLDSVRRVATLASRSNRQVRLSFTPSRLEISVQNHDIGGEARDGLPVTFTGDPFEIGFNAGYLLEILRVCDFDRLRLRMNGPTQACVLEPDIEEPDHFFILMPLRLAD